MNFKTLQKSESMNAIRDYLQQIIVECDKIGEQAANIRKIINKALESTREPDRSTNGLAPELKLFLREKGAIIETTKLTDWQYRFSNREDPYYRVDFYPKHNRYHDIPEGVRGTINQSDLPQLLLKRLRLPISHVRQ